MDVYELASATGLHISTVRFHLDVLAKANQISVRTTPLTTRPATPGRPRTVYEVRQEEDRADGYRPLAAALAAGFVGIPRTRIRHAEEAGRKWATTLIPPTEHTVDADDAARQIASLFADLHFDPDLAEVARGAVPGNTAARLPVPRRRQGAP